MERDVVNGCLDYLHLCGFLIIGDAWRQNNGAFKRDNHFYRFSYRKGISDIIGWTPDGKFFAVECKDKGGKLSLDQEQFLNKLNKAGGVGIVAYSLDDLINALDKYGYSNTTRKYR